MALHNCDEVVVAGFGYDMNMPHAPLHYYETVKMSAIKEVRVFVAFISTGNGYISVVFEWHVLSLSTLSQCERTGRVKTHCQCTNPLYCFPRSCVFRRVQMRERRLHWLPARPVRLTRVLFHYLCLLIGSRIPPPPFEL